MLKFSQFLTPEVTVGLLKGNNVIAPNSQNTNIAAATTSTLLSKVSGTSAAPLTVSYETLRAHRLASMSPSLLQHIDQKTFDYRCANCEKTFDKFESYSNHINLVSRYIISMIRSSQCHSVRLTPWSNSSGLFQVSDMFEVVRFHWNGEEDREEGPKAPEQMHRAEWHLLLSHMQLW